MDQSLEFFKKLVEDGEATEIINLLDKLPLKAKTQLINGLAKRQTPIWTGGSLPMGDNWESVYDYTPTTTESDVAKRMAAASVPTNNNNTSTSKQTKTSKVKIIVPSQTVAEHELTKIEGVMHYEERQLFQLLNLRDPSVRLIYVTSIPIHPSIVQYYLSLLPPEVRLSPKDVNERLVLMSTFDSSWKPLSQKIIDRPRMQAKIKRVVKEAGENVDAAITCFIPTDIEFRLSELLNVGINSSKDKDCQFWGTKCGSRQIFRNTGCPHPAGTYESFFNEDDLAEAVEKLWSERPNMSRVMVKLNEGFSGEGNALLDLRPVASQLFSNYKFSSMRRKKTEISHDEKIKAIKREFVNMRFQAPDECWENWKDRIADLGAIIEEFVEGQGKQSPSVQGIIHPDGKLEIISSHEQVLGGPDGQVYLGCRFPADEAYRLQLHEYAVKVGEFLAKQGAVDRFGVDFIAVPEKPWDFSKWNLFALEINLRTGGTTHPYEALRLLTAGSYGVDTGLFTTPKGENKYYIASDCLKKKRYEGLLPSDLLSIMEEHKYGYNHDTQTGVVFHLMGAMSQYGKVGLTCIANSLEQAEEIYERTEQILDEETKDRVVEEEDDAE